MPICNYRSGWIIPVWHTRIWQQNQYKGVCVMRVCINGVYRDATPEEISAWEQSIADTPTPEPTTEERIAALEEQLAAAKILLGLEE